MAVEAGLLVSPSVGAMCKCCLGCWGENELCWYPPSFTHPIIWVCDIAGWLAQGWMVPAPDKACAPHTGPAAPKPLLEVSCGSGLHSHLCCCPGSQGPLSSGKGRLSATPGALGKWSPWSLCSQLLEEAKARGSSGSSCSFQGEVR